MHDKNHLDRRIPWGRAKVRNVLGALMGRSERIRIEASPKLFDVVELLDARHAAGLAAGALGAIVDQLAPDSFVVEFVDEQGKTLALATLASEDFVVRP